MYETSDVGRDEGNPVLTYAPGGRTVHLVGTSAAGRLQQRVFINGFRCSLPIIVAARRRRNRQRWL